MKRPGSIEKTFSFRFNTFNCGGQKLLSSQEPLPSWNDVNDSTRIIYFLFLIAGYDCHISAIQYLRNSILGERWFLS